MPHARDRSYQHVPRDILSTDDWWSLLDKQNLFRWTPGKRSDELQPSVTRVNFRSPAPAQTASPPQGMECPESYKLKGRRPIHPSHTPRVLLQPFGRGNVLRHPRQGVPVLTRPSSSSPSSSSSSNTNGNVRVVLARMDKFATRTMDAPTCV